MEDPRIDKYETCDDCPFDLTCWFPTCGGYTRDKANNPWCIPIEYVAVLGYN